MRFHSRFSRFSVRSLAIVVTLVCVYFGAWEATKKYGTTRSEPFVIYDDLGNILLSREKDHSPLPFIVMKEDRVKSPSNGTIVEPAYFLWLFGPKIRLSGAPQWKEL